MKLCRRSGCVSSKCWGRYMAQVDGVWRAELQTMGSMQISLFTELAV